MRILIYDASERVLEDLVRELKSSGYSVTSGYDELELFYDTDATEEFLSFFKLKFYYEKFIYSIHP